MAIKINTDRGDIKISNNVMIKIIANVATSCYGVVGLTPAGGGKVLDPNNISSLAKGVKVKAEAKKLVIDLHIATMYGMNMSTISKSIRSSVKYQIEHFMGIEIGAFNIHVQTVQIDE